VTIAAPSPPRFEDLTHKSFDELQTYFRDAKPPGLEEMTGDTRGQFLAWHPHSGWLMRLIVWFLFRSWLGKRFGPPQNGSDSSDGINLFEGGATRYAFRAYVSPARTDGAACLRLDYSIDPVMRGLADDVRKIADGLVLGQIHYRFFWQRQHRFSLYFALSTQR
jgi:hypothetical protein